MLLQVILLIIIPYATPDDLNVAPCSWCQFDLSQCTQILESAGEISWVLVRAIGPQSKDWFPFHDQLAMTTDTYDDQLSVYNIAPIEMDGNGFGATPVFLFTTGDCNNWLITPYEEDSVGPEICASSRSHTPYMGVMYYYDDDSNLTHLAVGTNALDDDYPLNDWLYIEEQDTNNEEAPEPPQSGVYIYIGIVSNSAMEACDVQSQTSEELSSDEESQISQELSSDEQSQTVLQYILDELEIESQDLKNTIADILLLKSTVDELKEEGGKLRHAMSDENGEYIDILTLQSKVYSVQRDMKELKEEISRMYPSESDISTDVSQNVVMLQIDVSVLQNDVSVLQKDVSIHNGGVTALEQKVSALHVDSHSISDHNDNNAFRNLNNSQFVWMSLVFNFIMVLLVCYLVWNLKHHKVHQYERIKKGVYNNVYKDSDHSDDAI